MLVRGPCFRSVPRPLQTVRTRRREQVAEHLSMPSPLHASSRTHPISKPRKLGALTSSKSSVLEAAPDRDSQSTFAFAKPFRTGLVSESGSAFREHRSMLTGARTTRRAYVPDLSTRWTLPTPRNNRSLSVFVSRRPKPRLSPCGSSRVFPDLSIRS